MSPVSAVGAGKAAYKIRLFEKPGDTDSEIDEVHVIRNFLPRPSR